MSSSFRPLVPCYHAVTDAWPHALAIGRETLLRQVRSLLVRRYRPGTLEDVVANRPRVLHLTFDDAYRNVATVLPDLERLRVHATVFACSGYADDGRALDVPELADDAARYPDALATMGWDDLRGLVERGVEVQSHTVSHPHLPRLGDDELARELRESKERLEDELRRPSRYLAYPYGDEDGRVHAAARAAGYAAAFALPGRDAPINLHALPRVGIYRRDSLLRTTLKTSGAVRRPAAAALRALGRR